MCPSNHILLRLLLTPGGPGSSPTSSILPQSSEVTLFQAPGSPTLCASPCSMADTVLVFLTICTLLGDVPNCLRMRTMAYTSINSHEQQHRVEVQKIPLLVIPAWKHCMRQAGTAILPPSKGRSTLSPTVGVHVLATTAIFLCYLLVVFICWP